MVTYGLPAYFSSILAGFIGVYKNYLLAWFTSNIDIGNLVAATNLSTAITIFIFPVSIVLFPSFSKLDVEREINEVRELFRYAVRYSCILILPVSFFLMALSKDVIFLFYGSVFRDAPLYLVIAALPYLLVGLGSIILISFFNGVGMTNIVFRMGVINLAASLPLYYLLVYYYGVLGILVALALATFFMTLYGFWVAHRRFGVWVDGYILLRIYFAAFLSGLAVYLLRLFVDFGRSLYNVHVFGVLFLFLYLVFLPLFRGIGEGDVDILSMAFSGLRYVSPLFEVFFELERRIIRFLQR
jgi:O-antigen/teichoic acid export membrane protein